MTDRLTLADLKAMIASTTEGMTDQQRLLIGAHALEFSPPDWKRLNEIGRAEPSKLDEILGFRVAENPHLPIGIVAVFGAGRTFMGLIKLTD